MKEKQEWSWKSSFGQEGYGCCYYSNNNKYSLEKSWYSNGQLRDEKPYKNDIQHGARIEFQY